MAENTGKAMIPDGPIFVISPHSDDAFLSLGWTMSSWVAQGRSVEVLCFYSADPLRAEEERRWAGSIGAGWTGLGLEQKPAGGFMPDHPVPDLSSVSLPDQVVDKGAVRIWPAGIFHPDHIGVARVARPHDLHYVDTPYQISESFQPLVRDVLEGKTIRWWEKPPVEKWDQACFFGSQALLFETHEKELPGASEIIVGGPT